MTCYPRFKRLYKFYFASIEHDSDHGQMNNSGTALNVYFIVLCQSSIEVEPAKSSFLYSPFRQYIKPTNIGYFMNNSQSPSETCQYPFYQLSRIAAITANIFFNP